LGKSSSLNLVSSSKENPTEATEGLPGLDGGSDNDEEAFEMPHPPPPFGMAGAPAVAMPPPAAPAVGMLPPPPHPQAMLADGPACRIAASWLLGPSRCEDIDECVTPVCKSGARIFRAWNI
jgi:hypothetical protein